MNWRGYITDPLFLAGCALYSVNRWGVKPFVSSPFLRGHFNDLLLIPCALPILLLIHRLLGLRTHDLPPAASEVVLYLLLWTVLFEWIGPNVWTGATGDSFDAIAYAVGAVVAAAWWHHRRRKCAAADE